MHNYKNLQLWQKSRQLVQEVYRICSKLPKEEVYGLSSQLKRAAISIPSNIAEGAGRNTDKDFIRFLSLSQGSCYELETQLILAQDLNFLDQTELNATFSILEEVQKMNRSLQETLLNRNQRI